MTRHAMAATLLCTLGCAPSFADTRDRTLSEFQHAAWTAREGVPARISALAQTSDGYLWLGTPSGLYRFDGVQFEHYELPAGKKAHSDHVRTMKATSDGGLWMGFRWGGVAYLKDGRVTSYGEAEGLTAASTVGSIAVDHDGTVWAAATSGLFRLVGGSWHRVGKEWGYDAKFARILLVTRDGTLWVATEDTVLFLRRGQRVFQATGDSVSRVGGMAESPDGTVWVTMTPDIARPVVMHGKKGQQPAPVIRAGMGILFDRAGSLWLTTDFNVALRVRFPERLKTGTFDASSKDVESFGERKGLLSAAMRPAFEEFEPLEDREGDIWFATEVGLERFRPMNLVPVAFPAGTTISTLAGGEQGRDWTGFLWAPGGKSFIHIPEKPAVPSQLDVPVTNSYREGDGTIWLALAESRGILRFKDGQFSRIPLPEGIKKGFDIQAMTEDHSGNLWISIIQNGVFKLTNGVWVPFGNLPDLPRAVPLALMTDASGRVWFGYQEDEGVARFDGRRVQTFSSRDGLEVIHVESMYQRGQHIWIGGERGLALFDGSRFRMLAADGPRFSGITGIIETTAGDLWLNAIQGVIHIPSAEVAKAIANAGYRARFEIFDSLDGLQGWVSQPRPQPSAMETSDGRLWFLTSGGLFRIDPDHISRNAIPPPVFIRSADSAGKVYETSEDLSLPAGTRNLHISYTALSFSVPERVQFRYLLEGVDKGWQEVGARREAFYTNLEPGKYLFRVIASNNDGVWNDSGASMKFTIAPTYYQTLWFRFACLGSFLLLAFGLYRLRIRQMAHGFRVRMEERIGERTRIARDLHDTLLQSFQGVLMKFSTVKYAMRDRPQEAEETLERIIEQARQAITEGRDAVQGLRSSTLVSNDLARSIGSFGDGLASDQSGANGTEFRMEVEGKSRELSPLVQDEVYRIVCESLRNAFKHAQAKRIEVEICYDPRQLRLRVRDDGRGIDPQVLEAGGRAGHHGLPGMQERTKLAGGRLAVRSQLHSGTELELTIPASIAYTKSPAARRTISAGKESG